MVQLKNAAVRDRGLNADITGSPLHQTIPVVPSLTRFGGFFLTGAKPMALSEITAEITIKWWVKPLAHVAAIVFAVYGKSEFPESFVDFIVHHGTKIEIK